MGRGVGSRPRRRNRDDEVLNTADRLRADVEMLAATIGERNVWRFEALRRAATAIKNRVTAVGYEPGVQSYDVHKLPVENIEAALPGTSDPAAIVVVGAHYDSVTECPGANDNATGIAATLELARRFARAPRARTIRFVAFVNEEPPFFRTPQMGSVVYANAAKARGEKIVAMLSLETMGYFSDERGSQQYPPPLNLIFPDTGNFIGFVSNLGSARLLRAATRAFKARTSFPIQSAPAPEVARGCRMVGSVGILASRLSGAHGHRHGAVSLSLVLTPHTTRRTRSISTSWGRSSMASSTSSTFSLVESNFTWGSARRSLAGRL